MKKRSRKSVEMTLPEALAYAVKLHQDRDLKGAEELYRLILKARPSHPDALHYLGVVSHQLGKGPESAELIRRAIELQPGYADAYNNLGNVLKEQGMLAEAERMYRKVIELRPESAEAYNNLGVALKEQQRFQEALEAYRQAIALNPAHADAWHNMGNILKKQGNLEDALTAYRQAILLKPRHADAYKNMGRALYAARRVKEAVEVYQQWLKQDPDNPVAQHMLAASSGEAVPERASDEYVQQVFDKFSGSFDEVLKGLEYRAPQLIAEAVEQTLGAPTATLDVIDAGCGTGLCGPHLKQYAGHLVGVDLSPGMLAKASGRGVYDDLVYSELTAFLSSRHAACDLIVSADTLCYFGTLDAVLRAAAGALRGDGRLMFTVEHASQEDAPKGFRIHPHGRYSHTERYVRDMVGQAGLSLTSIREEVLRKEGDKPVAGLVVVAHKPDD
jgi:predicted TPR repeat methyltransferase